MQIDATALNTASNEEFGIADAKQHSIRLLHRMCDYYEGYYSDEDIAAYRELSANPV